METSRFEKGLELLKQIDGEAGKNVIDSLQDISPDLAKYTIEYPFGDIYVRKDLDLKSREIATVAALTALGNCAPQLKVHLNAALNVGCSEEEIKEVIIQMSCYAGFPAALNGMFAFKDVLAERTANHNS
ncbi:carboxymuconolactone decarboxylase family protein [Vibrio gigantis]|uniref:Carboxymuconolactone decarboxylase family protein n=1 Tax=Vibrio gigantis TaxID=296199 RepID=A0A5M9P3M1_9VIBR|nr:carboxymuconolactone decarboxylase family protein [Vibrio gigantis]KAA8679851.1 carboxymuconolactone decarboxylase family protein [Vibrio gigantis]